MSHLGLLFFVQRTSPVSASHCVIGFHEVNPIAPFYTNIVKKKKPWDTAFAFYLQSQSLSQLLL